MIKSIYDTYSFGTGRPLAPSSVHYMLYDTFDLQPGKKIKHLAIEMFEIKDYTKYSPYLPVHNKTRK